MFNSWRSCDNAINEDFELYSTYMDALERVNKVGC